jgi:hypothetical protein
MRQNDFFAKIKVDNGIGFKEFYSQTLEEESLVHPIFSNYKLVSLD